MENRKFVLQGNTDIHEPIHDSRSYIFTLAAADYKNVSEVRMALAYDGKSIHSVHLNASRDPDIVIINMLDARRNSVQELPWKTDANIVVRIEKLCDPANHSTRGFVTYINGTYIMTCGTPTDKVDMISVGITTSKKPVTIAVTALDFADQAVSDKLSAALRNPAGETNHSTIIYQVLLEKEEILAYRETVVNEWEKELIGRREGLMKNECNFSTREKALEEREKVFLQRERSLSEKERTMELEQRRNASMDITSARRLKLSTNFAWPMAVTFCVGDATMAGRIQEAHRLLMKQWVEENIHRSESVRYFVYSQEIAWPKAVIMHSQNLLPKIGSIHDLLMGVLRTKC